ncbi:MAG: glycosyltransferase, exosortase A system-associated [Methylococcaceae bacterium]|nr:glycosyltransferase, exosortase A system-associated [Methylococcaceae bacterium]MCI0667073.1 glycosyltransferase, exosortase A system-associated [Methylococcaceae bacterium]
MRILHVLDHSIPLHSGYTFRTRAILEQQRALGWETFHVTSAKHEITGSRDETVEGLHFFRSDAPIWWLSRIPVIKQFEIVRLLAGRISEIVEEIRPDIIHAHSPALNGLAALMVTKKFGLPLVYECRAFWEDAAVDHGTSRQNGFRYRATRALESYIFEKAAALTVICDGIRTDLLQRGFSDSKITVVPNSVDIEHFSTLSKPDEKLAVQLGLTGKTVLGFIGSFYAYEGLLLALEAMPAILREYPDVCLLLVGGGPQEKQIRNRIFELELDASVILAGRVPHDEIQNYYQLVDIFVYPRLSMRLTELVTPLKPLEAMAQSRLVVASDVGGHKELIRHGETGQLFQAGNVDALSRSILDLLDRRGDWKEFQHAGRKFVEQERNWAASVRRYAEVYRSVL